MYRMLVNEPKILTVNREHIIGSLVGKYGDDRYWHGFYDGFLCGGIVTSALFCLTIFVTTLKR